MVLLSPLLPVLLRNLVLCDLTSLRKLWNSLTVLLMAPLVYRLITMDRSVRETE